MPQSEQKLEASGLSVSHLGHLMAIIPSYSDCQKNINECEKSQTELIGS